MLCSRRILKWAAWLLFMSFFIVYMVNADRVYYTLSGKSYAVELPESFSLRTQGDMELHWSENKTPVNNKFEEGIGFWGLFRLAANTRKKVTMRVFFKSPDACYEMMTDQPRLRMKEQKVGVKFFAATSMMKKGVYQMGVCFSDEGGEQCAWINKFFEKKAGGLVKYSARPVPVTASAASKDLKFALEKSVRQNRTIDLKGWAVLKNADMDDYSAYIAIRDTNNSTKAFYAPLYTRRDIASQFADSRAANCGFQISIAPNEIAPGRHSIKVMVKSRETGAVIESVQTKTRDF